MLIQLDQDTYKRIARYSSLTGISANLVVKEALNEWMEETGSLVLEVLKEQNRTKKAKAKKLTVLPTPTLLPAPPSKLTFIDSSVKFDAPTVGLVDMLSVQ